MSAALDVTVVPDVTDRDQAGFWAAARRGELVVQVCEPAGHILHLPRGYCSRCDSFAVEWRVVDGRAHAHTWTTVEHTVDSAFPAPYTVVLVELDEVPGVRFVTHLDGRPELSAATALDVRFQRIDDQVTLPRWVVVGEGPSVC